MTLALMKGSVSKYETAAGPRWRIQFDGPPDPVTGKRRVVTRRGFTRERDAQRALRELLGRVERGEHVEHSRLTVAEYLRGWLEGIRVEETTLAGYRQSAEVYAIPRIGGLRLQALTPEHLDVMYRELERSGRRNGKGLAPKTVRHVHTMLRRALQDAVRRGHVVRNVADLAHPPTAKQAASKASRDKIWTEQQLRTFLTSVSGHDLEALWWLLCTTGMRRSEVVGLRWDDIDLEDGVLHVRRTVTVAEGRRVERDRPKTQAGQRTIALDPQSVQALRRHRARQAEQRLRRGGDWPETGMVFTRRDGHELHPGSVLDALRHRIKDAGLPPTTVHGLRHSYATAALRAGVSPEVLSKRLGHTHVATTLSIYAHVRPGDDRKAADLATQAILRPDLKP